MPDERKKHIVKDMRLDEISLVDVPANSDSHVTLFKRAGGESAGPSGESTMEETMTIEELKKQLEAAEGQVQDLTKARDTYKAEAEDAKSKLKAKEDKMKKSADTIEFNGERIEKSSVPPVVLEAIEKQNAEITKMKAEAEMADLRKRAEDQWPNLAGSADQKAKLLKSVEGMDEADKDDVLKSLKAADAAVAKAFQEVGTNEQADENSASAKLEKMAREHAQANSVSYETAFSEVTKSGAGRDLLVETRKESN